MRVPAQAPLGMLMAAALAAVPSGQATPQTPQFRGGGSTVAVPVTVVGRGGRAVTGLEASAFRVFDEGRLQAVTTFVNEEQPVTAAVLVDTSASMTTGLELAKFVAEQFVIRMRAGDRAKVGSFSDRLILNRAFTGDRDVLLTSIRQDFHIGNPTRLLDAVDSGVSTLVNEPGRRVVLLLTDGCDTASTTGWPHLLQRIRTEEVVVYALQLRTRIAVLPENQSRRVWDCVSLEQQYMTAQAITSVRNIFQDARHALHPDMLLERLTQETGGSRFMLRGTDNVNALATQLLDELRQQYILGFVPERLDGKFHTLRVEVDNKDWSVHYRRSYLAAPPRPGER